MIALRRATADDAAALWQTTRALADHHGHLTDFVAGVDDFARALADPSGLVQGVVATWHDEVAGIAVWHRSFSTFYGKEVMYLEDLSVLPAHRRKGIARALMVELAGIARERGLPRIMWNVMAWNDAGKALYAGLGAVEDADLRVMSLSGAALQELGR